VRPLLYVTRAWIVTFVTALVGYWVVLRQEAYLTVTVWSLCDTASVSVREFSGPPGPLTWDYR
jgi:hypothetical protein